MKRLLCLLLLLATATLTAQQSNPRFRVRWGARQVTPTQAAPRVTITTPTLDPDITVPASSIVLEGLAESTSGSPIALVTWSCPACSPTSGTAQLSQAGLEWETSAASSAAVIVQDSFTGGSTNRLDVFSATEIGGAWDEAVNTGTSSFYLERRSGGWVQINSGLGNGRIINTVAPSPALTGTNYDVSVTLQAVGSADGDDGAAIIFGYQDSDNYCAALWYGPAAATDLYITKNVAGTVTTIGTPFVGNVAVGDVMTIEVRGTSLDFKQGANSRVTATTSDCDSGSGVGIGLGGFRGIAGDDATAQWHLDDFTVSDQDGSSGSIGLALGENVITVTAIDGLLNTGTDTITVTRTAADTEDPQVTITQPTANPTQTTATAAIVIHGECSDNVGCTSVALACPECTPASASCTLSGTGLIKTFVCDSVTQAEGPNALTVTAEDAATNDGTDLLTSTLGGASDVTPPVMTIRTNGGSGEGVSFSTTSASVTLNGDATDAVGVLTVTGSCTNGTLAAINYVAGTNVTWSTTLTAGVGANVCTFTATDAASLTHSDSITVTYTPPVNITTLVMASGTEDSAYGPAGTGVTLNATGGTAPYTWTNNGAGTSLNDADAECAGLVVSSAGVVSGTPTVSGTCAWTAKATDNSGGACPGAACDTQALSIVVNAAGAAGPHDYYESLRTSGECFKAYSMRPQTGQTTPVNTTAGVADCTNHRYASQLPTGRFFPTFNWVSYCFTGTEPNCSGADDDPQKQDAMKMEVQVFNPVGMWEADNNAATNTTVLAENITDTQQQFTILHGGIAWERGKSFLVGGPWPDGEIMTIDVFCKNLVVNGVCQSGTHATTYTVTVSRGQFGTSANQQAWNSGEPVQRNDNGLQDNNRFLQIKTDGSISATYLFTWDTYWVDGYQFTGMPAHKFNQISTHSQGQQWAEFKPLYQGSTDPLGFQAGVDVGTLGFRWYSQSLTAGFLTEPGSPLTDENGDPTLGFIIKPDTWTRVFMLVEANAETDTSKYVNSGQRLITTGGMAASSEPTQITISHDLGSAPWFLGGTIRTNPSNPFTSPYNTGGVTEGPNQAWPGRRIKIDDEIMTVISGQVDDEDVVTRFLTVRRGEDGTTPATHAFDAPIYVIDDYVTIWIADENNNARMITNRLSLYIPTNNATPALRGQLGTFWIEADTSEQELPLSRVQQLNNARGGDLVSYSRNLIVLKNPPSCTASDCSAFLVKPVR
jgi:hypothetical protein